MGAAKLWSNVEVPMKDVQITDRIRKVPFDYSWKWLLASAKLAFRNYPIALGVGFIVLLVFLLQKIPIVGDSIHAFIYVLFSIGQLLIAKAWFNDEQVPLEKLFVVFTDVDLFRRVTPIALLNMLVHLLISIFIFVGEIAPLFMGLTILVLLFLTPLSVVIMAYSVPLILFQNENTFEAVKLSVKAFMRNIFTEIGNGFLIVLAIVLSAVFLLIPTIFALLPAFVPLWYIRYVSVFENQPVESLLEKLSSPQSTQNPQ